MYAIAVWLNHDTSAPSIIGPYEGDLAFDDANLLRESSSRPYKVQVCQITSPENAKVLALLSSS